MEPSSVPDNFIKRWWFKGRYIMPTLIYIQVGTIATLMLIRLLVMLFGVELTTEMWDMWIPVFGSWIPVLMWYSPRIKILTTGRFSAQTIFLGLGWLSILVPLVWSQYYVEEKAGASIIVNSIDELKDQSVGRFYQIKNFKVDTSRITVAERVSEKGHERHEKVLRLFFIAPINADTTQENIYWFGEAYVHGNGVKEYLPQHHDSCYARDRRRFTNPDFSSVDYFVKVNPSNDNDGFRQAIALVSPTLLEKSIILTPGQGLFDRRGDESLSMLFYSALIADLIYAVLLLFPKYNL